MEAIIRVNQQSLPHHTFLMKSLSKSFQGYHSNLSADSSVYRNYGFPLSSRQFAKTHLDLAFQNNTQKQVLMDWADGQVCSIDWESINADDVINKGVAAVLLDNSLKDKPCLSNILSSSNALVCIVDLEKQTHLVINPCTGESRKIPVGSHKYDRQYTLVHGFGYASKSDDYKLVKINGENFGMYSLRSGTWSNSTPQMPCKFLWGPNGVLLNGALHWLGGPTNCVVVCFDLDENTFRQMPSPIHRDDIIYGSLGVINGCLCAHYSNKYGEGFWVMREYNNGESWTKISTSLVPLNTLDLPKMWVDRQKLERRIVLCNFENGTHGIPTGDKFQVGTYVESLISPNHYVGE